uniref:Uncharacterized protein n=1 Tax=Cuerna arida TaxID=1464854 RepID=A0A1B6FA08_9HEMI
MEKEPQQDNFTAIPVKDYPPSHNELYTTEPPPAYQKPKSSLVQVVRIVALTIIALTVTVGVFNLASIYIQANAVHRLQQLQNRHEQKISQIPKAESLVQQKDDKNAATGFEIKNHVRRDSMDDNRIDSDEDDNSIETEDNESKNPVHVKFPIQFNLEDLSEAILGLNSQTDKNNNNNNKKSRMNCIVEKKVAEKMINHEPKNIQLPFGVNLTTDKGFEHLSGEKIIILCESGSEQQPQQQPQPIPVSNSEESFPNMHFVRKEQPISLIQQFEPQQPQQQPNREAEMRFVPPFMPMRPRLLPNRIPLAPFNPLVRDRVREPQQMIFITRERIPLPFPYPITKPEQPAEEKEQPEKMKIPEFIQNIAEEIIRDHIESAEAGRQQSGAKPNSQNEQRLPLPETLLSEINRLPNPEMILSITAEKEPMFGKSSSEENSSGEEKSSEQENEPEAADNEQEMESARANMATIMDMIQEHEKKMEEQQQSDDKKVEGDDSDDNEEDGTAEKVDATTVAAAVSVADDKPEEKSSTTTSTTSTDAGAVNLREGRHLSPVPIPVQMIPQVDMQERPHYVYPRSV